MEYLAFALAWPRFIDAPLRPAKRRALVEHVAPAFDALRDDGTLAHWSHTFWGTDDLGTKVVRVVAGTEDATAAADAVREAFADFEEGTDYRVEAPYDPERFRGFWGGELETWLAARAHLSTLAVAAVEERLGESYEWHRRQNRPGHVWANQLGLTYMDEAAAYQRLALGYFDRVPMEGASEEQRAAFDAVREHMEAAADALPDVK
ncbi:hypothetical protein [Halosegnis marinus]|uniref:Uncharacterized protein n=1 Tax=Halosegnis marinus TaxID=3034023 RepID=A0ABD5ZSN0_9EURY|nr:hypothetical protein [Halosegnis sp. DT85]